MLKSSFIRSLVVLLILLLLLGLVFGWQYWRNQTLQEFSQHQHTNAISVEIGEARTAVWYPQITAIGTVRAVQGIEISPEVDSKITKIFFTSGSQVKAGDPLVELNDATAKANLANAQAAYDLTKLSFNRDQKLAKMKVIAAAQLDIAKANMDEAAASVQVAQAALDQLLIKAPFAGRLGLSQVSVGQTVPKGTPLVSLQQVDPVYVDFSIRESLLSKIHAGNDVQVTTAAYPDHVFAGKILARNADLNVATRTLNIRASVPNPDGKLLPGMFVEVNVMIQQPQEVTVVPAMAINYSTFGDSVFLVVNNKAVQRYVTIGEQRGAEVAVQGINAGDTIVTAGVFKLQDGSPVIVSNHAPLKITEHTNTQSLVHDIKVKSLLGTSAPASAQSTANTGVK